jgi:hypothetical protein
MNREPVSLLDCMQAHVVNEEIICRAGHRLVRNGHVWAIRMQNPDDPLLFAACQGCPDLDHAAEVPETGMIMPKNGRLP